MKNKSLVKFDWAFLFIPLPLNYTITIIKRMDLNTANKTKNRIKELRSCLCVGLDSQIDKLPEGIDRSLDGLFDFNSKIISKTSRYAVAYKLNFAFYERYGIQGMEVLEKTINLVPQDIHIIADAKRGDIGNTSKAYADSAFSHFRCDSITVSPYMGRDSVEPFLEYSDKMIFLLALTSNPGNRDFQRLQVSNGKYVYQEVIEKSCRWADADRLGFVVGATNPEELKTIRRDIPDRFLLIPGVGKQGGSAEEVMRANQKGPALVNSSRAIIYPSNDNDWLVEVEKAASETSKKLSIK